MNKWSGQNPDHLPIMVVIDLKKYAVKTKHYELYPEKINEIIFSHIDREKIYTNNMFLHRNFQVYDDLLSSLENEGWPTIGELRGKFIFILSGSEHDKNVKKARRHFTDLKKNEIFFVDFDENVTDNLEEFILSNRNQIVYNFQFKFWLGKKFHKNFKLAK